MTTDLDLARLRPLVEIMAAERTKDAPHLFEDAVQEGLIAAWEASEQRPGKDAAYYRAAARNGVMRVARDRPMTGAEGRRGWRDAHDSSGPLVRESADGVEYLAADPEDVREADALRAVETRDEILAAIDALPLSLDVAIVHGRYWLDLGFADLAKILGRPAGTLSRRWSEIIRPALAASLAEVRA